MEEDKNIFGTIMFDILALSITLLLSTVNVLYFIFMVASCVLVLNAYKDISKYKNSNQKSSKKTSIIVLLSILSLASLVCVILVSPLRKIELSYSVYGISGPVFLVTAIYSIKDYLENKKAKTLVKEETNKDDDKIDFVVKDMGTSIDRENQKKEEEIEVTEQKDNENN